MHDTMPNRSNQLSSAPAAVVDALNALLEAETHSLLRFMGEGYPYLSRTTAEVRQPLQEMIRRRDELREKATGSAGLTGDMSRELGEIASGLAGFDERTLAEGQALAGGCRASAGRLTANRESLLRPRDEPHWNL